METFVLDGKMSLLQIVKKVRLGYSPPQCAPKVILENLLAGISMTGGTREELETAINRMVSEAYRKGSEQGFVQNNKRQLEEADNEEQESKKKKSSCAGTDDVEDYKGKTMKMLKKNGDRTSLMQEMEAIHAKYQAALAGIGINQTFTDTGKFRCIRVVKLLTLFKQCKAAHPSLFQERLDKKVAINITTESCCCR